MPTRTINVTPMENYSALAKIFFDFHSVGNMLLRACLRPSHSAIVKSLVKTKFDSVADPCADTIRKYQTCRSTRIALLRHL